MPTRVFSFFRKSSEGTLFEILDRADPAAKRAEQVVWLEDLAAWLLASSSVNSSARFRFLLQSLEKNPEWNKRSAQSLWRLLSESSARELFVVLPRYQEHSFLGEGKERLFRKLFPGLPRDIDLRDLTERIFDESNFQAFFEDSPPILLLGLWKRLPPSPEAHSNYIKRFYESLNDSLLLVASRLSTEGLSAAIRERAHLPRLEHNPFFILYRSFDELHKLLSTDEAADGDRAKLSRTLERCTSGLSECRELIQRIFSDLEESGVSIDLVYRLEGMQAAIERLYFLLPYAASQGRGIDPDKGLALFRELVREQINERSLSSWLTNNLHLVSRKLVEHSGESGEHYIARSPQARRKIFWSAAGGGILTAFTTVFKFLIGWAKLPLLPDMLASTVNYAGSFIAMQMAGFTLATKQPSMTASALAGKLKGMGKDKSKKEEVVATIRATARTQFAAAGGNVLFVIPTSIAFAFVVLTLSGEHFLSQSEAQYVLSSLHPLLSMTIPFAAFTGVLLWMASLAGGWVDNWAVYRRFFDAIESSPSLHHTLGAKRCIRLAAFLRRHLASLSVSVALGFFLAATPVLGKFIGIPFDVRHVTLTAGALSLALFSLGPAALLSWGALMAMLSVVLIGLLNFGVSFVLSLLLATRAHSVPTRLLWPLFRRALRKKAA